MNMQLIGQFDGNGYFGRARFERFFSNPFTLDWFSVNFEHFCAIYDQRPN